MEDKNSELREFSRVPFHIVAELKSGDLSLKGAPIRDISLSGIFLEGELPLEEGNDCEVSLTLEGVEPPIKFELQGQVVRVGSGGYGIKFVQIPLESYDHLNHIVQLNAKNPHQSEDEIKNHVGLNPR